MENALCVLATLWPWQIHRLLFSAQYPRRLLDLQSLSLSLILICPLLGPSPMKISFYKLVSIVWSFAKRQILRDLSQHFKYSLKRVKRHFLQKSEYKSPPTCTKLRDASNIFVNESPFGYFHYRRGSFMENSSQQRALRLQF